MSNTAKLRATSIEKEPFQKHFSDSSLTKAFKNLNRQDQFMECCEKGSYNDLEALKNILQNDSKS